MIPSMPMKGGWIPHADRTVETTKACDAIMAAMPRFHLVGNSRPSTGKRVCLWDFAKKVRKGVHVPTLRQMTGCCVGAGAWNALTYSMYVEIALGDNETPNLIFMPYHYGRGRLAAGIRGRGEGSTGAGQAKAILADGVLSNDENGELYKPTGEPTALTWGADQEMTWSDGAKIADKWIQIGKKHPFKTAAPVTTYEQVRDAIVNGYAVTVASMQGFQMKPRVDRGKAWGVPSGQWAHQMSFLAVDDDSARPGAYLMNNWSADAHGPPVGDEPPGGFWVDADTVERMVAQEDSFAYSAFEGFPARDLDFHII